MNMSNHQKDGRPPPVELGLWTSKVGESGLKFDF